MPDLRRLFAEATAAMEDVHGIAVGSQRAGLSPDAQRCYAHQLQRELGRIRAIVRASSGALS